ncbi:hypothetical protein VDGL01_04208 [Verticillium dahliae]
MGVESTRGSNEPLTLHVGTSTGRHHPPRRRILVFELIVLDAKRPSTPRPTRTKTVKTQDPKTPRPQDQELINPHILPRFPRLQTQVSTFFIFPIPTSLSSSLPPLEQTLFLQSLDFFCFFLHFPPAPTRPPKQSTSPPNLSPTVSATRRPYMRSFAATPWIGRDSSETETLSEPG